MKMRARALPFAIGAMAGVVLAGLAGCAGELDPSLLPGGSSNPLGQAGSGGGTAALATRPRWYLRGAARSPAVTRRILAGGAGLDLASAGVVGRLLGQGPSTNVAASAACESVGKPYLVAGSNPSTGLLMDKMDAAKVTCGSTMSALAQLNASQVACLSAWATAVTTGVITQ